MSHVRGRFINTWQLLICDSISSSQYGQACQYPKLWPKSCRLVANGREQCFVHSSVANCQLFGWTLWFYICELPVDRCHMTTASRFWNSEHLFAQSFKNCELVFSHRSKLCIGILPEFQNCESVFPPPQSPSTKYRCSPSINYCYTSVFFSSAFYG